MEATTVQRREEMLSLRLVGAVILVLVVTLVVFYLVMRPPLAELGPMAAFLSLTAALSVAAGYGAYRLGWIRRSPRIRWTLLSVYALSSVLTFVNVWVTARLMFASTHDLMLATLLLLFATGIALALGTFFSAALTGSILVLNRAADRLARGDLGVRVPLAGRDELAGLSRAFNEMAGQLEEAARKQREVETLRRDLLAWVGHDLRTPLASIRAIVEALADGMVDDPAAVQRYLRTAQHDIRSLSLLIDDLFQLAQLDAGGLRLDRGLNSLSDLISDTLEGFSALAARQDKVLEGDCEPGLDPVFIDVQRIGQVLRNLLDNALRHTPAGGRVELRCTLAAESVRVEVRDSGEGIAPEDLPHIFEQFYRGEKSRSRATGGAGLGLAIARGIVLAHGGEIGVESRAGAGTRFYFTLPRGGTAEGNAS